MLTFACQDDCCKESSYKYWLWWCCVAQHDLPRDVSEYIFHLVQFIDTINFNSHRNELEACIQQLKYLHGLLKLYDEVAEKREELVSQLTILDARLIKLSMIQFICDKDKASDERLIFDDVLLQHETKKRLIIQSINDEFIFNHESEFTLNLTDIEAIKRLSDFSLNCLYRIHDGRLNGLTHRVDQLNYFETIMKRPYDLNYIESIISPNQKLKIRQFFKQEAYIRLWELYSEDGAILVRFGEDWGGVNVISFWRNGVWIEKRGLVEAIQFIDTSR